MSRIHNHRPRFCHCTLSGSQRLTVAQFEIKQFYFRRPHIQIELKQNTETV